MDAPRVRNVVVVASEAKNSVLAIGESKSQVNSCARERRARNLRPNNRRWTAFGKCSGSRGGVGNVKQIKLRLADH